METKYKVGILSECTLDDPMGCPYCFDLKKPERKACNFPRPVECFYHKDHHLKREK